tara:strand:- start:13005 stop:14870 length:1866 start_codon:yes stop_codon:yes gene_type:complete
MPLKKLLLKPGVNRENTRYTTEGGWYECDKIRFRQGTPEAIGGWTRLSNNTFNGICRSLWNWVTLAKKNFVGIGTNTNFYLERGGIYYDITPFRATATLNGPFTATSGSPVIAVYAVAHGGSTGEYVAITGALTLGQYITAAVLNQTYEITAVDNDNYTINVGVNAGASDTGHGGATVTIGYEISPGPEYVIPIYGWGAGYWGQGVWGSTGAVSTESLRIWSQTNFGQNLVFGPRGGAIYYWDAELTENSHGVEIGTLAGASQTPTVQNFLLVSDASRFVFAFGTNDLGTGVQDPMLIRWSDQESIVDWNPQPTNQAGSLRLSHGSSIITAIQTRQEIVVITDSSVYSLQYLGAPYVWGSQLLGDNISIASQNAVSLASGVLFWMGVDKFYLYDGAIKTLSCDLRKYVFSNINKTQFSQVFSGTNEAFNEVWWFYCSAGSIVVDSYVTYNYLENVWAYGTMLRSAWLDSGLRDYPLAASYSGLLLNHEVGVDNNEGVSPEAINAYVQSSEFDIDDGHNFSFIWRLLPDLTFEGSTAEAPSLTMTLYPMKGSGSGYTTPASVGGSNNALVVESVSYPIEEFTNQIYTRVRGRQLSIRVESDQLGTTWQLGAPRIDIRQDGRR